VHADTHKYSIRPNVSTDTIYTTEGPVIYECTYPTTYHFSYTWIFTGHMDPTYSNLVLSEDVYVQPVNRPSFGHKQNVTKL
jgi:hypothetical protein